MNFASLGEVKRGKRGLTVVIESDSVTTQAEFTGSVIEALQQALVRGPEPVAEGQEGLFKSGTVFTISVAVPKPPAPGDPGFLHSASWLEDGLGIEFEFGSSVGGPLVFALSLMDLWALVWIWASKTGGRDRC